MGSQFFTTIMGAPYFFLVILASSYGAALGYNDTGILDCLTNPCVTVPGVGKLKGSIRPTQFTGRDVYAFMGVPYGEDTTGENRFAPPKPKPPLNDGESAFDATYMNYLLDWWDHVCPQPGLGASEYGNPMLAQWAAENPDRGLPTGPVMGSEDCLHLAVFTPQLPEQGNSNPRLPVMVYIHGGSFMLGGYIGAGPGKLLERDMVLVAMQYRVGPLGFITKHPKQYLMDAINNGWLTTPKKSIFGANKHEGSFVLGMIYNSYILPNGVVENEHF